MIASKTKFYRGTHQKMDNDGCNINKQIKVYFDSGFNNLELVPYDAYVRYGGVCHVIRCATDINGTLLVYGSPAIAACTGKEGKAAVDILSEVSNCDHRLKHGGIAPDMIAKEVCVHALSLRTVSFLICYIVRKNLIEWHTGSITLQSIHSPGSDC